MTPAAVQGSHSRVNVLRKADELLELLAKFGELTITELAERAGEPRSTVYRLVATLEELGFAAAGRRPGSYQLGVQLYRYGHVVSERFRIRQSALGPMKRLFEASGETVFLMVRHRHAAVCVERIDGRHVRSMAVEIGGSLPLHLGAAPLVLLAFAPEELRAEYLTGQLEAPTGMAASDPDSIRRRCEQVRREGYAISDQDLVRGIAAIGMPIRGRGGEVSAALSLSGAQQTILGDSSQDLLRLLREAADEVASADGAGETPASS
jgi:DNA-binding IclR family transcriptional regulator